MSTPRKINIAAVEKKALKHLSEIVYDIDSPDLQKMYDAVGRLATVENQRALLPKAMDLFENNDQNVKQAAFIVAGKLSFGKYTPEIFASLKMLNPAEREQVLQGILENFNRYGSPESSSELKRWIDALAELGKGHQPTVFGLMKFLGKPGKRWVTKQIKDNLSNISLGAVPALKGFPEKTRKKLIRILSNSAAKKRRDMLPYICGIVDHATYSNLSVFLKGSKWQERVEIASAIASSGISSTSGFIMELVDDSKWQVKQALIKEVNIRASKFTALTKILSFLAKETHQLVRTQAERALLLLGSEKCTDTTINEQRKRLEKQYRTQLLKAAEANTDIDSVWLGIEIKEPDPMHEILEKVTSLELEQSESQASEEPVGLSLEDISSKRKSTDSKLLNVEEQSVLMAALLGAQKKSLDIPEPVAHIDSDDLPLDPTIPPSSKFLLLLQRMSERVGKDVPLNDLLTKAEECGMTKDAFDKAVGELEKEGIIYRSSKGTVSYVDMEL
ncbi:MAG: hypothetical protein ACFFCP_18020 [Promethearchaeota archaeon]